jgi:hypothetical protein
MRVETHTSWRTPFLGIEETAFGVVFYEICRVLASVRRLRHRLQHAPMLGHFSVPVTQGMQGNLSTMLRRSSTIAVGKPPPFAVFFYHSLG